MKTTTIANRHSFVRHLSPTVLAALSVELAEATNRDAATESLRLAVDRALECNCGGIEADQLRMWVRENVC